MKTRLPISAFCLWILASLFAFPATASDDDDNAEASDNAASAVMPPRALHVIHISVDGLRADAVTRRSPEKLPNLYRLRNEGAFTDNARTDYDRSNTLPNHTSQLTGRPVLGSDGHHWTKNRDPQAGETLHSNRGEYVASVFDVAHDHGLSTALYTTKSKFVVFDQSYNEVYGAADRVGADNGRDKIDRYVYDRSTDALVDRFVTDMDQEAYQYAFIHLRDPDTAGHTFHWNMRSGSSYLKAVEAVDRAVGRILEMVTDSPTLAGNTVIILTADHGGGGEWHNHGNASNIQNYTIPFYVWGYGVDRSELYSLNHASRVHPGMKRPAYDNEEQPIRNGDAANLALAHLGLPSVPGSTINAALDLLAFRVDDNDAPLMAAERDSSQTSTTASIE